MVCAFIGYGIGFLSIIFVCCGCGSDTLPVDKSATGAGEKENLLLPYDSDWSRYFPLYYQSVEKDQFWYFMEQPGMLEAESEHAAPPTGYKN